MKIKEEFILRKVAGVDMAIPIGNSIADFNGVITLNETAAFLWRLLMEESEPESLTEALCVEYEVSAEQAEADVRDFINLLEQAAILI